MFNVKLIQGPCDVEHNKTIDTKLESGHCLSKFDRFIVINLEKIYYFCLHRVVFDLETIGVVFRASLVLHGLL